MMLYASLDFHSCFPDKFHSGPLTFSRQQVLSIFSPSGNENVTTNDVTFSYPKATKMIQQSHTELSSDQDKLTFHIYLHSVPQGK